MYPQNDLIRQAIMDLHSVSELSQLTLEKKIAYALLIAGPSAESMHYRRKQATQFLSDVSAEVRMASILLLDNLWQLEEKLAEKCEYLALKDPDGRVRGLALDLLIRKPHLLQDSFVKELIYLLIRENLKNPQEKLDLINELDILSRDLKSVKKMIEDEKSNLDLLNTRGRYLNHLAGPMLDNMLRDFPSTTAHMDHPDPRIRAAVILLIANHWKHSKDFGPLWLELLRTEHAPEVRYALIEGISEAFSGSENENCCAKLAAIVISEDESQEIRLMAADGIYQVSGLPPETWPSVKDATEGEAFQFPHCIDWELIRSYLH